jgi:putative spermidine/putrescine transport system substrate-binding protein
MHHGLFSRPSRRSVLTGIGIAALAAPNIWSRKARASQQLAVRTPGGAYDEIRMTTVYEPFRKATGIEIIPVAATAAKLLAMHRSGQMEVDLIDTGDDILLQLHDAGALAPIDLKSFKRTDPDDIEETVKRETQIGGSNYAKVMGYHTAAFNKDTAPKSWAEFWDIKAFPGPRTLTDMAAGAPDLAFALLADGVPMDKLYPLDIDRAFKALSRIRPAVTKFWDTGAMSAQMLADKEVVLAALWSSRIGAAIDKGAPLAIQWNQNAVLGQAYGIPVKSQNMEAALAFIDFSLSPAIQSNWLKIYQSIPVNKKSYKDMHPALIDPETNLPWTKSKGFVHDIVWWSQNRTKVNAAWNKWIAQ